MAEVYSFRSLPPGVREEAEARGRIVKRTLTDLRTRVMPRHRPMDIDYWERTRGDEVIRLVTQAQAENAELVDRTFNLTLLAQGYMTEPIGEIRPEAFAGVMPDGDPLDLIPRAVANRVRERLATGAEPLQAWQAGGKLLATIVQTALSDSQRMAKMVAGFARPRTLYVRMLRPPSCSRCTVLAGKRGFWDKPFQRHPGCDCTQVPVPDWSEDTFEGPAFDPVAAFEQLPASEQDRLFTKAGAEAIRSGADIAQVVNSRSGMSHVGDSYTRVGATARGKAVQYFVGEDGKLRKQVNYRRLSVPKIVEMTEGNPDGRIALLYRHGYIRSVKPGSEKGVVLRSTEARREAGQLALKKQLESDLPKIDMSAPVRHVVDSKIRIRRGAIYSSGGHSYEAGESLLATIRAHPELSFRGEKTFFPPYEGGKEALAAWLEEDPSPLKVALENPKEVVATRTGRKVKSLVSGPDGETIEVEFVLEPARKSSEYDFKIATLYPIDGKGVSSIKDSGGVITGPLMEA